MTRSLWPTIQDDQADASGSASTPLAHSAHQSRGNVPRTLGQMRLWMTDAVQRRPGGVRK